VLEEIQIQGAARPVRHPGQCRLNHVRQAFSVRRSRYVYGWTDKGIAWAIIYTALCAAVAVLHVPAAYAHHSIAMYDKTRTITLKWG